jgi:calpain-7
VVSSLEEIKNHQYKPNQYIYREGDSAAGGPRFNRYLDNPTFELQVDSASRIKYFILFYSPSDMNNVRTFRARLQLLQPSPPVALNITIFPAPAAPSFRNHNTLGQHVTTSGPYVDLLSGAATPLATFQPGNYLIVPSTFQGSIEKSFKIEVFSSAAGVRITPKRKG